MILLKFFNDQPIAIYGNFMFKAMWNRVMKQGVIGLLISILLTAICTQGTMALTFKAEVEETEWRLTPSIFECVFSQPIPNYGEAVFYHEAGEDLMFHLKVKKNLMNPGGAGLHLEPPNWAPSRFSEDLGIVQVKHATQPLNVEPARANQMMMALMKGLQPTFTRKARFNPNEAVRVALSAANFNSFYKDYLGCVVGLLPVNFRQVEKSKVLFKKGNRLDDKSKKKLDLIILYVKADPSIKAIYVDGHSDGAGRRYHNRRLSEERALNVNEYMVKKGIDAELFTTRYHGERYPVASNKTYNGRYQNRRVTIRLEKEDEDVEF
jgi:outer membrane protein OmpA-like peptidoglycan-associated protein